MLQVMPHRLGFWHQIRCQGLVVFPDCHSSLFLRSVSQHHPPHLSTLAIGMLASLGFDILSPDQPRPFVRIPLQQCGQFLHC
jgi:hypothetical protein